MIVVLVSVCPFPRTTVLVPILSLLTEDRFRGRPARPQPAGPPWNRTSCRPHKRLLVPVPCPPPSSLFQVYDLSRVQVAP